MNIAVIRGAITVEENTKEQILENTTMLLQEIISQNSIALPDIVSVIFTATKDIDAAYPAVAARALHITEAGLMCMQEMYVEGSLPRCIRVMIQLQSERQQSEMKHVYLKEAVGLRPDLHNRLPSISD